MTASLCAALPAFLEEHKKGRQKSDIGSRTSKRHIRFSGRTGHPLRNNLQCITEEQFLSANGQAGDAQRRVVVQWIHFRVQQWDQPIALCMGAVSVQTSDINNTVWAVCGAWR
jgi:hypothetical protein